ARVQRTRSLTALLYEGHGAGLERGRIPDGPAVGAPVDRRAAAAQDVRERGPEEEVPAAPRQGRRVGVCLDRTERGLGPGGDGNDRGAERGRGGVDPER